MFSPMFEVQTWLPTEDSGVTVRFSHSVERFRPCHTLEILEEVMLGCGRVRCFSIPQQLLNGGEGGR
jgi:hypothetical protein